MSKEQEQIPELAIDLQDALTRFPDEAQLKNMVGMCIGMTFNKNELVHKIIQTYNEKKYDEMQRHVHTLKGRGAGLSMQALFLMSKRVDDILKKKEYQILHQQYMELMEFLPKVHQFMCDYSGQQSDKIFNLSNAEKEINEVEEEQKVDIQENVQNIENNQNCLDDQNQTFKNINRLFHLSKFYELTKESKDSDYHLYIQQGNQKDPFDQGMKCLIF